MILVLALVTATLSPSQPHVGDPISVTFTAPPSATLKLDRSSEFEVLRVEGNRAIVRTFRPKPFAMSGTIGDVRFRNLRVPVRSVLKPKDDLAPAPLAPPHAQRVAWWPFVVAAALLVAGIALFLFLRRRRRRRPAVVLPAVPPDERFRRAVLELRTNRSRSMRWAALADETRVYLAATRPHLGSELTTTEVVSRLPESEGVVAEILRQGDLEKFSTQGPDARDFDEIAERALALTVREEPELERGAA